MKLSKSFMQPQYKNDGTNGKANAPAYYAGGCGNGNKRVGQYLEEYKTYHEVIEFRVV